MKKNPHTVNENEQSQLTVTDQARRIINELQQENTQLTAERNEFIERNLFYRNSFKKYEEIIKTMVEERIGLREKIVILEQQLANNKASDASTKEDPCVLHNELQIIAKTQEKKQLASCDSGICMNSHLIKEDIGKTIDSVINTKLKNKTENTNVIKHQLPIRNAISHKRENNLIIHGMAENNSFSDEDKVQDMFGAIRVKYKPVTMLRLGTKEENKNRPLMVRLNSKKEKGTVLSKLGRLKYVARRCNERISVTHDYTSEERRKIKELVDESKRRNMNEQNDTYTWKVRGMQIVKIFVRGHEEDPKHKSTS